MMMSVEQSLELMAREAEILGEDLPNCHSVHHKSNMTSSGLEAGPPRWEAGDQPPELWYGLVVDIKFQRFCPREKSS
jgi:hypothetical protein